MSEKTELSESGEQPKGGALSKLVLPNDPAPRPAEANADPYRAGYRDGFQDSTKEKKNEGGGEKKEGEKKKDGREDDERKGPKLSPLAMIIIAVVGVALIILGLLWWHYAKTHVSTDDAYTMGHVHQMSPRVQGQVIELNVDDNQHVQAGAQLIKLDTRDYDVALERAESNLQQANAQVIQAEAALTQAKANVQQADAGVAQARAQQMQEGARYEVAGINYGRTSSLYGKDLRAVAKADVDTNKGNLDAAQGAFQAATANVQSAEAHALSARATVDSRAAELKVAQAQVSVAQAGVDDAKLQLSYCWVLAPCDGRVSRRTVEVGQRLSPGQSIMAITEDFVWVQANLKETQLENVRVGMKCKLPIDAYPNHTFIGRVDSIQNGSGATYSLLPPDNATGNFTKIVQRVPVKLVFDPDSMKGYEDLVVPGLSVVPVIDLTTASNQGENTSHGDPAAPKKPGEGKKK